MKKGVWKYFHKGDDFIEVSSFVFEILEKYTNTIPNKSVFEIDGLKITRKIRITIDIFDDEN